MMLAHFCNSIVFFMLSSLLVLMEVLSVTMGGVDWQKLPMWRKFRESWIFVWFAGLVVLMFAPFVIFYEITTKINHFVASGGKKVVKVISRGHADYATSRESELEGLNWTDVLLCALWIGVGMISLQVGVARINTLFLSWFNSKLAGWPIPVIIFLFACVGIFLFMIPVIPGVPVYLSGGIVLTNAMMDEYGFGMAFLVSTLVCFALKLIAVALQQKGIGARLGHKPWIRQLVGINTLTIRAIKLILSRPGIHLAKVAILCGGPDWPTSVLTGILGLPLCDMVLGSIPVYFIIAPTCASSAMLLVGEEHSLADYSGYIVAFGGFCQVGGSLLAVYFISQCVDLHRQELLEMEDDAEVAELDRQAAVISSHKKALVHYHNGKLNICTKLSLMVAVVFMSASCYIFFLLPTRCFIDFELTDSIDEKLDGNVLNVVKNLGWIGMALFTVPCVILKFYYCTVSALLKARLSQIEEGGSADGDVNVITVSGGGTKLVI
jgi:hypothetical protein